MNFEQLTDTSTYNASHSDEARERHGSNQEATLRERTTALQRRGHRRNEVGLSGPLLKRLLKALRVCPVPEQFSKFLAVKQASRPGIRKALRSCGIRLARLAVATSPNGE